MRQRFPRSQYPWWVKVSIWGVPTRNAMWGYFTLCIGVALECVAYGFVNPIFFLGGFTVLSAIPYYFSIRWIDQYGTW